jgi:glyoxylase-like metal-dependent hydrolase (beta-lactamase superfamily II)
VNVFFLDGAEPTLIDSGYPGSSERILAAVRKLGRDPTKIRHIIATHCHADHAGGLADLKRATGAQTYAHPEDADLIGQGHGIRSLTPGPTVLGKILFKLVVANAPVEYPPAQIDHELIDGQTLPWLQDARVIHAPGHCQGQICLLWPPGGGVLFAADSAAHIGGLNHMICHEDFSMAQTTLSELSRLEFARAVFGHGRPIGKRAHLRFRKKFSLEADGRPATRR